MLCVEGAHRYEARWDNASTRPGYHQVFGNTLAEVDGAIGEITASLEQNGLAEDTLIVMTADNVRQAALSPLCARHARRMMARHPAPPPSLPSPLCLCVKCVALACVCAYPSSSHPSTLWLGHHSIGSNKSITQGPADLGSVDCDDIGSAGPFLGGWQKSKTGGGGGGTWKSTEWEGTRCRLSATGPWSRSADRSTCLPANLCTHGVIRVRGGGGAYTEGRGLPPAAGAGWLLCQPCRLGCC
eukprot:COSAG01_NODE_677_length_14312_cov_10.195314_5_plen_242_part_00